MKFLSIFLIAILALGALSTELETNSQVQGGQGLTTKMKVTTTHKQVTEEHPRQRRWGYYGGYGGYGGMGYGGMGYGRGYGMGYGGYGGYYG
ncbi:hypothetical protein GCK72_001742 [Caenorhabditis remanei]|uniref:Uncharacterized protein n=2 Tax=Caenorhabditis remanei TaxID=31234 RepID=E3LN16_CAERE|nr:hypothetical protein GCK72_001742 [Caenorhabditis remanei]EFP02716.1 hypothetical protein CRE_28558 [Caenorhabditis remanei]KAF1769925.1 hypothetical protein GCK72_001742 [Caenorhabditis remanei]